MRVLRWIMNSLLLVATIAVMGVALLNFLSAPDGSGLFGYKGYTVLSGSMEPEISAGDYIVVSMTAFKEIEEGDVITFQETDDSLVTHRVIEKTDEGLATQGDANNTQDAHLVEAGSLIGEMQRVVPKLGSILLFMRQPLFIIAILLLLIISLVVAYYRSGQYEETVNE